MTMATNPAPGPSFPATARLRIGLGTFVAVEAEAHDDAVREAGLHAAFDAIARVDTLLHPTRQGSDLAAINCGVPGLPLAVHPWTRQVLELAVHLHHESRGVFDPCLPESEGRLSALELPPGIDAVIAHRRLTLDLGGIGKGYAVDRGIAALRASGCAGGLVNAGGDLAVFGARAHKVVCRDARGAATCITLRDAALATSDVGGEARPREHRGYYDGRNGHAIVSGRVSVTAPCAASADALTKCLLADAALDSRLLDAFDARRIGW